MSYESCPNCGNSNDRAVYQCSNCDCYGCMEGTLGGFAGPYSGCWPDKKCPNCGHTDTKEYKGRIVEK